MSVFHCIDSDHIFTVLHLDLSDMTLHYCECQPVAQTLMKYGLFPCAPVRPSIAFDINLLEMISINMCYLAPNLLGWSLTLEWFWRQRGYMLGARVNIQISYKSHDWELIPFLFKL